MAGGIAIEHGGLLPRLVYCGAPHQRQADVRFDTYFFGYIDRADLLLDSRRLRLDVSRGRIAVSKGHSSRRDSNRAFSLDRSSIDSTSAGSVAGTQVLDCTYRGRTLGGGDVPMACRKVLAESPTAGGEVEPGVKDSASPIDNAANEGPSWVESGPNFVVSL